MRIIRHLERSPLTFRGAVVTLGNFDGVHVGHQEILKRVVGAAAERAGESVVITFYPHPTAVLAPARAPAALVSLRERLIRIRDSGVTTVVLQRFTRAFAQLTAEEFVEQTIVGRLGATQVIVGHNVNFGRGRAGSAETLERLGQRFGFAVEVVGPVTVGEVQASSSEIRRALGEGNLSLAERLLGRPYAIEGRVVTGDRRGRGLGFPTANLRPRLPIIVPDGVYAVRVHARERTVDGVANIGRNPTFGEGRERVLEAHLFDFDGDLYGQRLRVALVRRLRGEERFSSPQALVEQIHKDVAAARDALRR